MRRFTWICMVAVLAYVTGCGSGGQGHNDCRPDVEPTPVVMPDGGNGDADTDGDCDSCDDVDDDDDVDGVDCAHFNRSGGGDGTNPGGHGNPCGFDNPGGTR